MDAWKVTKILFFGSLMLVFRAIYVCLLPFQFMGSGEGSSGGSDAAEAVRKRMFMNQQNEQNRRNWR